MSLLSLKLKNDILISEKPAEFEKYLSKFKKNSFVGKMTFRLNHTFGGLDVEATGSKICF